MPTERSLRVNENDPAIQHALLRDWLFTLVVEGCVVMFRSRTLSVLTAWAHFLGDALQQSPITAHV